jgi:hypothetical protein
MPTTSNFGWTTPADTDLVKDGALAIRTLGNGIDTSFLDLKGGTTGQNLRKASNTDLDFTFAGDATNTVIDAEGDLLVGDSADTLQRLAIGTTGQVLTVDTTLDGKVKWASPAGGGGKVLQVVQATTTTQATITATSLTDTNLSVSITPSSASSKVLILVSQAWRVNATVLGRTLALGALLRDSTNITINSTDNIAFGEVGVNTSSTFNSPDLNASGTWCLNYLDTPNTTSAITYKTQAYLNSSTTRTLYMQSGLSRSMIIALEIGA